MNRGLRKNYVAPAAIGKYRIVKPGANPGEIAIASAAADKQIGVTTDIDAAAGDRSDVVRSGITPVYYGGNVAVGDPLTSDANGAAVVAAPAAGANARIVGIAELAGAAGDIGEVFVAPSVMQG
jgi:hypothetical protein